MKCYYINILYHVHVFTYSHRYMGGIIFNTGLKIKSSGY